MARHPLADDRARELERRGIAHARPLQLKRPRCRLHRHPLVAVAVRNRLAVPLVALPAEEVGQLLLERLLQNNRAPPADRLDRVQLLTAPATISSSSRRSRSLAAILAIRAYLLVDVPGQRGGYARPKSPGTWDATNERLSAAISAWMLSPWASCSRSPIADSISAPPWA